jgi:hypothetical protein
MFRPNRQSSLLAQPPIFELAVRPAQPPTGGVEYIIENRPLQYYNTTIMATIALINPFPNNVQSAFEAYISSDTYHNREQLSYEKWSSMCNILNNPAQKP